MKLPCAVKNMYSDSLDLSAAAGSLNVTFHSLPYSPSICSKEAGSLTAAQDLAIFPEAIRSF